MIWSNSNHDFHYIVNIIVTSKYFHNYTRCLIICYGISCQRYGLVCMQKITIELIYPLMDSCHIYTHNDLSVYLFYEHERKMCWNTDSDVVAIINHINRHSRLTVFTRLSPTSHKDSNHAWLLSDTVILTSAANVPDWPAVRMTSRQLN